jgi:hypothetical protein
MRSIASQRQSDFGFACGAFAMSTDDPSGATKTPPANFAFGNYGQAGTGTHKSGWEDAVPITPDKVAPPFGSQQVARSAAKGSIASTPLAQRLSQRVADFKKG